MRRHWILRGVKMVTFAALALALIGYVVMVLWNAVLPAVTGLHAIRALAGAYAGALATNDPRGARAVSGRIGITRLWPE
jgi:hypothetical protein